jgi:hypothetical protein
VVREKGVERHGCEAPQLLAVPINDFDKPRGAACLEARRVGALGAVAQQVTARKQVRAEHEMIRAPLVHDPTVLVEEEHLTILAHERVSLLHLLVVALQDADGAFRERCHRARFIVALQDADGAFHERCHRARFAMRYSMRREQHNCSSSVSFQSAQANLARPCASPTLTWHRFFY